MSKILIDSEQNNLVHEAVELIKQQADLKAQKSQVQSDIAAYKITHKASILADNWEPSEFRTAVVLLDRLQGINARVPEIKTRLNQIKDLLVSADYKNDVQAVVDSI